MRHFFAPSVEGLGGIMASINPMNSTAVFHSPIISNKALDPAYTIFPPMRQRTLSGGVSDAMSVLNFVDTFLNV